MNKKLIAMGKKIEYLVLTLFFVSLLAITQNIQMSHAQYEGFAFEGLPTITINSPGEHEAGSSVSVSFTIEKPPTLWITDDSEHLNKLSNVEIVVDGYAYKSLNTDTNLVTPYQYATSILGLGPGNHTVTIEAHCQGWVLYYMRPFYNRQENYSAAQTITFVLDIANQPIPKPSVPEFTVELADHSYNVPPIPPASPTYTTDPYSGKQVILSPGSSGIPGYHVQNFTIDIIIVNQPYPAIINGNSSFVYYDVRIKGHFGQDWTELFPYYSNSPIQSNSQYTVISLPANYHVGDQIDIQVQAAIGYKIVTLIGHPPIPNVYTESVDFQHASSDWSPTQTLTIPEATQSPSPSPTIPEFPAWLILPLLVAATVFGAIVVRRRRAAR